MVAHCSGPVCTVQHIPDVIRARRRRRVGALANRLRRQDA